MYRIWIKVITRVELFLHADGVCVLGAVVYTAVHVWGPAAPQPHTYTFLPNGPHV